jgi:chloramphenicol-sensitive protein RarD
VSDRRGEKHGGLMYGLAAYGLWGVMPVYFRAVAGVAAIELLAHRIVWGLLFLVVAVSLARRWPDLAACLRQPRTRWLLAASTALLAVNWYVFIYGVSSGRVVETSLGYFINPLVNVVLGVLIFRERLRGAQAAAVALAAAGVVYLIWAEGRPPWIGLCLAVSFALYGLVRKVAPVEALAGLTAETLLLFPLAAGFLLWWHHQPGAAFTYQGPAIDLLLLASGVVTAVPLLFFGLAARRLPLTTLGLLQYLTPTMQFLLAVLAFGEPFTAARQVSFGLIWAALALVTAETLWRRARRRQEGASTQATAAAIR